MLIGHLQVTQDNAKDWTNDVAGHPGVSCSVAVGTETPGLVETIAGAGVGRRSTLCDNGSMCVDYHDVVN